MWIEGKNWSSFGLTGALESDTLRRFFDNVGDNDVDNGGGVVIVDTLFGSVGGISWSSDSSFVKLLFITVSEPFSGLVNFKLCISTI